MKLDFNSYLEKDDWVIAVIPTFCFGNYGEGFSIGFVWLCFCLTITF